MTLAIGGLAALRDDPSPERELALEDFHRRFRHGFIYINKSKGIREAKDLVGRRIGVRLSSSRFSGPPCIPISSP